MRNEVSRKVHQPQILLLLKCCRHAHPFAPHLGAFQSFSLKHGRKDEQKRLWSWLTYDFNYAGGPCSCIEFRSTGQILQQDEAGYQSPLTYCFNTMNKRRSHQQACLFTVISGLGQSICPCSLMERKEDQMISPLGRVGGTVRHVSIC